MAGKDQRGDKQRVLIAGSGIAGVEAALALRDLAGDRVQVDLRDSRREFVFRPFAVGEPYGAARVFRYDLSRMAERCGTFFRADGIVFVDVEGKIAVTRDGERLPYDHLVIATGVQMLRAVPGAVTFWGAADQGRVGDLIGDLRAGGLARLAFTMPAGHSWALPLYELALLATAELAKGGTGRTRLTVVTPEDAPLGLFGRRAGVQMAELLAERGIEVICGAHPVRFDAGRLRIAPGDEVEADAVISLPRLEGQTVAGVTHDGDGFIGVDEHGRAIGLEHVFAAGDVTAFPVKQVGVATQQADAVAEAIAAEIGVGIDPDPFDPVLRGELWTGGGSRYLYGRPTGGHGEASSLGERLQGPPQNGKVTGRYLASFLDALVGESGGDHAAGPAPSG